MKEKGTEKGKWGKHKIKGQTEKVLLPIGKDSLLCPAAEWYFPTVSVPHTCQREHLALENIR